MAAMSSWHDVAVQQPAASARLLGLKQRSCKLLDSVLLRPLSKSFCCPQALQAKLERLRKFDTAGADAVLKDEVRHTRLSAAVLCDLRTSAGGQDIQQKINACHRRACLSGSAFR